MKTMPGNAVHKPNLDLEHMSTSSHRNTRDRIDRGALESWDEDTTERNEARADKP